MSPPPLPADPRTLAGRPASPRGSTPDPGTDVAAAVEHAMAGLAGLAGRPPAEHVAVFERVHAALGDALAAAPAVGGPVDRA